MKSKLIEIVVRLFVLCSFLIIVANATADNPDDPSDDSYIVSETVLAS